MFGVPKSDSRRLTLVRVCNVYAFVSWLSASKQNQSQNMKRFAEVHMGLCKMYEAEVWGKRPVIQHYLFGEVTRSFAAECG